MHRRITTGAALAAALVLAGCSSSSDDSAKPAATKGAASTTASPTATAAAVKLSATWVPKLQTLADGDGVSACSSDSGSDGCVQAISDSVDLFSQITEAINTTGAADRYPKTIAEITKLVGDADTYSKDECPGDPNADVDGSPCAKNALAVVVGVSELQMVMPTDEANAGAA